MRSLVNTMLLSEEPQHKFKLEWKVDEKFKEMKVIHSASSERYTIQFCSVVEDGCTATVAKTSHSNINVNFGHVFYICCSETQGGGSVQIYVPTQPNKKISLCYNIGHNYFCTCPCHRPVATSVVAKTQ